jgi:hypothetical protein
MFLNAADFESISEEALNRLIENGVSENRSVEYKRDCIGNSDDNKKEFLKDVSAFANASGGYLIIGMEAANGVPITLRGVTCIDIDAEVQRLDSMIRDNLEPRLIGHRIKEVQLSSGARIIIIRIPKSWNPPHRINFKGWNKFFTRNTNGNHELNVEELRSLFVIAASLAEDVRKFRIERIAKLYGDESPALVEVGRRYAIHIVPLLTFRKPYSISLVSVLKGAENFKPIRSEGCTPRFNFDGVLITSSRFETGRYNAYTQVFRDGCVETACGDYLFSRDGLRVLDHVDMEQQFFYFTEMACKRLAALGVGPPYIAMLSLLDIQNSVMSRRHNLNREQAVMNTDLLAPEVVIEDMNAETDWPRLLRPAVDAIWNGYGYAYSTNFDSTGAWRPQRS